MIKIRLTRKGKKKYALYNIIAADVRAPRDGKFIKKLGTYNPHSSPSSIRLNIDETLKYLMNGAQPTKTVRHILSSQGVMFKKHLQIGINKKAITQEEATARFDKWQEDKKKQLIQKSEKKAQRKAEKKIKKKKNKTKEE